MRFIVCSDNHGRKEVLQRLLKTYPEAKAFIHCGDNELSHDDMKGFDAVTGNNDYFYTYPESIVVDVQGLRVFVTHSHTLPYGNRVKALAKKAREHNCTVACYGHSHIYNVEKIGGVLCLNPGSLSHNRDGSKTSYMVVDVDGEDIEVTRHDTDDLY